MRQVVAIAKQRMGKSPEGKATLQEIIENLGLDREMISEEEESDWNAVKELRKFQAGSKHRKDFERRLKQKLIKLGKDQMCLLNKVMLTCKLAKSWIQIWKILQEMWLEMPVV